MTPQKVALVQSSFAKVVPISAAAAKLFYGRLFELDPSVRPMFKGDMEEQGKKLMQVIAFAVASLGDSASLVPAVRSLGLRHSAYGVRDEHYDTVGQALLWTLQHGLGDEFTPAVREAWAETYATLATLMKNATAAAEAA